MQRPRISVIVPTLNEQQTLPSLLGELLEEPHLHECIVADGGSSDKTTDIVGRRKDSRLKLVHSRPGRGTQMNAGASCATGEMLVFHHADSRFSEGALDALCATAADPSVQWGGFQHRFSDANWKLRFISRLHNFRFRCSGTVYGDQSMFVRRSFFEALKGFPEEPLEDLLFSDEALKQSKPTQMQHYITTDSRKFVQMGELRALAEVVRIVLRYQFNRSFKSEGFFAPYR